MKKRIKKGLRPTQEDNRDFKLGSIVRLPLLKELPEEFIFNPKSVKNQLSTDFCTAFSSCGASELQENVILAPEWSFAVGKMIEGNPKDWGLGIRDILTAHIEYGAINKEDCPFSLENKESEFLRYIDNYPDVLFNRALKHKKKAYVKIDGPYDHFDNIRATIYHFRKEKRAVISGILWDWGLRNAVIPNQVTGEGIPHCLHYIGWKKVNGQTMLVTLQTYGKDSGDEGMFYIPRTVVNYAVNRFNSYIFVDEDKGELKKKNWTKYQLILNKLKIVLQKLINILKIT